MEVSPSPYLLVGRASTVEQGAEAEAGPDDAVLFFGVSLVLGIASRHLLRGTRVPYTVALLLLGLALGGLEYGTKHGLGKLGAGIRIWAAINPDLLLAVFLPALLFESSFSMEGHQIKKCLAQMVLLAVPGVVISTFLLGSLVKFTFPYDWNWKTSFLFSGLLSATDPVAVVALLKDLGASKKLSTIIEGESLMNDGTAIVVYQLFYRMVLGTTFDAGSIIKFLSQVSLGAVAVGLAFGIASVVWLGFIFNDTIIEISLTLAVSYIAFFIAQDQLEVSGVLAVMTLGMFYAAFAKTAFKGDSQQSLHHFWEMVAYIANTLIFILSGVVIADGVLQDNFHFERHGDSEIAKIVIDESTAAGEEAKKFLEDVRVTFPQVLRALKTRQVTYAVLTHLSEYIQDLGKTGLLEEKEMVHLDDALQTDLKKLKRNPPLVKMPRVRELLNTHPLVGALPAALRDPLLSNTKETIKGHGTILYGEGSRPTGIWLVSTGIVKWTSRRFSTRHSLDPILSHGSTLGLYEALTGKPYICDIITESVVHCFFIEAETIEQLRQSDPSIEDFMWQESALVIARIFLPQIFEKMAMREMRVLISERSSTNIYILGEDIELGHNYVGILLEGFLKTKNLHSITAPAVLLPSNTDLNLFGLQSSAVNHVDYCYTAPSYQVETRARVILFELGRPEREADLQRSASLLPPSLGPPRTQSKEHVGLLRWPDSFKRSRGPGNPSLADIRDQPGSYSARALQVSMYGGMMDDDIGMHPAQRRQPRPDHAEANQKHSASYPKVPSAASTTTTRRLLSVKSEGSNVMNRKPAPPLAEGQRQQPRAVAEDGNSSDESVGEEIVVTVDSPSMLSLHPTRSSPPRGN